MTECELDHTDGRNLVSHEDFDPTKHSDPWPVVYEDPPKSGYRAVTQCRGCGETIHVFYRQEEITDSDGETIWERGE